MHRALPLLAAVSLLAACNSPATEESLVAAVGDEVGGTTSVEVAAVPLAPAVPLEPTVPYRWILYGDWIDADGDCQDTDQEVLIAESLLLVTLDADECRVVTGLWLDPYTGQHFTDPGDLEIDHLVSLREAHDSGADRWTAERREAFTNDLGFSDSLIVVSRPAKRSKRGRDPAEWLPPDPAFHCDYVRAWVAVKEYWQLEADPAEAQAISAVLAACQ